MQPTTCDSSARSPRREVCTGNVRAPQPQHGRGTGSDSACPLIDTTTRSCLVQWKLIAEALRDHGWVRTAAPSVGGNKRRRGAHSMRAAGWRLRALREGWPAAPRLVRVAGPLDGDAVLPGEIVHPRCQSVSVRRPRGGLGELTQGFTPARLDSPRTGWFVDRHRLSPRRPRLNESDGCTALMDCSVQRKSGLTEVRRALI